MKKLEEILKENEREPTYHTIYIDVAINLFKEWLTQKMYKPNDLDELSSFESFYNDIVEGLKKDVEKDEF